VLEAQRAGEVGERALDYWRWGGLRGVATAAALEKGRVAVAVTLERHRAAGSQELERCQATVFGRVLEFLMCLGLAWAAQGTKSTRKIKSPASRPTSLESRVGFSSRHPRSAWTTSH
jgi:hypothetical protein